MQCFKSSQSACSLLGGRKTTLPRSSVLSRAQTVVSPTSAGSNGDSGLIIANCDAVLRAWVEEKGGRVDSRIAIVDNAPCGSRGVVALKDIPAVPKFDVATADSDLSLLSSSLITIPADIYLTLDDADYIIGDLIAPQNAKTNALTDPLGAAISNAQLEVYKRLPPSQRVALLLAHERTIKEDSFWYEYILSLPSYNCAGWSQPRSVWVDLSAQLASRFQAIPEAEILKYLDGAKLAIDKQVELFSKSFGSALGVSEEDIRWALGTVLSRSFGGQQDCGMAPYIDCANHNKTALRPTAVYDERDDSVHYVVLNAERNQPRPLKAGQELFITYNARPLSEEVVDGKTRTYAAVSNYLNFGFLPPEYLEI